MFHSYVHYYVHRHMIVSNRFQGPIIVASWNFIPYKFYVLGQIGLSKQCRPRSDFQNASKRCWWNGKQHRSWSDCFFRSSLILVCTVCWDLSVPIHRIFTVGKFCKVYEIFIRGRFQSSVYCSNLKFCMRIYIYKNQGNLQVSDHDDPYIGVYWLWP